MEKETAMNPVSSKRQIYSIIMLSAFAHESCPSNGINKYSFRSWALRRRQNTWHKIGLLAPQIYSTGNLYQFQLFIHTINQLKQKKKRKVIQEQKRQVKTTFGASWLPAYRERELGATSYSESIYIYNMKLRGRRAPYTSTICIYLYVCL